MPPVSQRLTSAAESDLTRLYDERERLHLRREHLSQRYTAMITEINTSLGGIDERILQLESLLGGPARPVSHPEATPSNQKVIEGLEIRVEAVRLLQNDPRKEIGIHYKEWYDMLAPAGLAIVSTKTPESTFLTNISRSPLVEKGQEPGFYRLNLSAQEELEKKRSQLRTKIAALYTDPVAQNSEEIQRLVREVSTIERQLIEIRISLEDEKPHPTEKQ